MGSARLRERLRVARRRKRNNAGCHRQRYDRICRGPNHRVRAFGRRAFVGHAPGSLSVEAALDVVGPERLLYASDFYISHMRGTNFPLGDTFIWMDQETPIDLPDYAQETGLPLVGIESLRAVKAAFWSAGLSDSQIEGYFWGNASALLGLS